VNVHQKNMLRPAMSRKERDTSK